jgi:hypothetical protein
MISSAKKFLFIHIPKTAGNSIQRLLATYSEDRIVRLSAHQDGIERFEVRSDTLNIHKHSVLSDYRDQLDDAVFKSLFKFTCIRNPWDRCVSHFFSPHRGEVEWSPETFSAFIQNDVGVAEHFVRLGEEPDPFDNMDMILRFENLDSDLARLTRRLKLKTGALSRLNRAKRSEYRDYYYSQELIDMVAEKFQNEISRFGYAF